jgi:hypothetical protein
MIRLMRNLPDNVLGVLVKEKITGEDYESVLIPAFEEKLKAHAKIRMLYHIENDFDGFAFDAMWKDAKLGLQHNSELERIALVSDHEMINSLMKFFGHLISSEIKIFKDTELDKAKGWISEQEITANS